MRFVKTKDGQEVAGIVTQDTDNAISMKTLAGVVFGQTVLAKALQAAGIGWDSNEAHSAAYDAQRTAELFCVVCNRFAGQIGVMR